jgi:transposase
VSVVLEPRLMAEQEAMALLETMPGGSQRTAAILLADMGTAMGRVPSAKPLASWAGLCPGHHERAGKRVSGKPRQGRRGRRQVRVEAAHVAATTQQTDLAAQDQRLAARRGKKRARMALGPTILMMVSYGLARQQPYQDLGTADCDTLEQHRVQQRLGHRLARVGYPVSWPPSVA